VGDLLADARRGLEMKQQRLVPSDAKLPRPAPFALLILLAAKKLRETLTWTPTSKPIIELLSALLAVCGNYTFFCRAETCARCLTNDLTVDILSQQICLFVRKSRGDKRRDMRDKLVLAVLIQANPRWWTSWTTTTLNVMLFARPNLNTLPLPLFGASHLWNPPQSGKSLQPFQPG
jgi:hypothetical protein